MKVTKDQVWFILLQGIGAIGSILVGKAIAYYFQPAEFGKYFIATSLVALYGAVITNPVIQSYRHLHFRKRDANLFTYYRSFFFWQALFLLFILMLVGCTGIITVGILTLIFLQIVLSNTSSLHMANINIQGYTTVQSMIQAVSPFINISIILGLVFIAGQNNYRGIWWSLVIAEFVVLILTLICFKPHRKREILSFRLIMDKEILGVIFRFAKPLIFLPLFVWIVNNMDRYLLDYFYSKNEVGIYSAAYGLGAKIFLMAAGALVAFLNASVYQQMTSKDNYSAMYKLTLNRVTQYLGFGLIIVFCLYVFSDTIGKLLLSEGYSAAFELIPLLGLANLFFTTLFIPEQVLYAIGKTKFILFHYAVGAIANLILNIILIPQYGALGAGVAMVLSSITQLIYLLILFRQAMTIKISEQ